MSQGDEVVSNQARSLVRTDFNSQLLALISNSSGLAPPGTTYAYQWWIDTTLNLLKIRNAANNAWITVGTPSVSNLGMLLIAGGTLTGVLLAAVDLSAGFLLGDGPAIAFSGDFDTGFMASAGQPNVFYAYANDIQYMKISSAGIRFMQTGATTFASGTTAQRPGSPVNGMIRYNSDLTKLEAYTNGSWKRIANGVTWPFASSEFNDIIPVGTAAIYRTDFSGVGSRNQLIETYPWSDPVALPDPVSPPPSNPTCIAMTKNSEFIGCAHVNAPRMTIYQRNGTELVKLANPATVPTATSIVRGCSFSPNGEFFTVGTDISPFIYIYQRAAGTSVWTKLADPVTLPTSCPHRQVWSPNGEFLFLSFASASWWFMYQRSGATFTKIADPASLPGNATYAASWSPDGRFFALGCDSPYLAIYERTANTTFTKLSNPGTMPTTRPEGVAFSNSGEFLALAMATPSNIVMIYQRSGTTFTKLTDPLTLPNGYGRDAHWSPDDKYLAIGSDTSPYVTVYQRSGTTFTKISNPSVAFTGNGGVLAWSQDGQFLAKTIVGTPFLKVYQTASDMPASSVLTINKKFRGGT